jgi:D-aminoacyl-tRNA deacylase
MKAVVQRVKKSSVSVDNIVVGEIGRGLLVLLGVDRQDKEEDALFLADKITGLRIFEDDQGKMNVSLAEIGGEMLVVSQFTLLGDCRKGRRPSFVAAAPTVKAEYLYEVYIDRVRQNGISVQTGKFQAMMEVSLINDGPVTLIVESKTG